MTVRRLPVESQDEIARAMLALAGSEAEPCSADPRGTRGHRSARRQPPRAGEFATEDQVRAVWAKHGL